MTCILVKNTEGAGESWCGREVEEDESRFPHIPDQIPNLHSDEICQRCANKIINHRIPLIPWE